MVELVSLFVGLFVFLVLFSLFFLLILLSRCFVTPSRRWLKTFNLLSYAAPVVIGVTISFFFFVLPQLVEASLNGVHSSQAELLTITDEAQKLHHSLKEIADLHADSLLW